MANEKTYRILWVDDDRFGPAEYGGEFLMRGYDLRLAYTAGEAMQQLEKVGGQVDLVILDVRLEASDLLPPERTHGGFRGGIALGEAILAKYPNVGLLGFSVCSEDEIGGWFTTHGHCYLRKGGTLSPRAFFAQVEAMLRQVGGPKRKPKIFIVHGHDDKAKLELKNYLQNTLELGEAVILHEQPSLGRTIIEKLEGETADVDIVFVILTADDSAADPSGTNMQKRRARQNVIFELGYFYGKLGRQTGKVLLCHGGGLELPSDISGIVYIDISKGIGNAGEEIRSELHDWLPH